MILYFAQKYLPLIQAFTPMVAAIAAGIALFSIRENIRINKRNKRADAIFHCNQRYEKLYELKISIRNLLDDRKVDAVEEYYSRFWKLKSDEFDYWLADLIDADTFSNWQFLTLKSFEKNHSIINGEDTSSFRYGWEDMGKDANDVANPWFTEYITTLIKLSDEKFKDRRLEHEILVEILNEIEKRSSSFRKDLRAGLSFEDYKHTRITLPFLGLQKVLEQAIFKRLNNS